MISRFRPRGLPWTLLLLGALPIMAACGANPGPKSYSELDFASSLEWPETEIETFSLDNGVRFFLVENHELPLVQVTVSIRSGEFQVPEGQEGLAELLAQVMRSGGSQQLPADDLNTLLEDRAAQLNVSMGFDSGEAGLNVLRKDLEQLLPVFVDVLRDPALPQEKISLAKRQMMTDIARRNDNQDEVGFREFKRILYGPDTVYGRLKEFSTLSRLSRDDLLRFHRKAFQGANLMVGVTGDIQPEKLKPVLEELFSAFEPGRRTAMDFPPVDKPESQSWYFIDKPDVNQTMILLGHDGDYRTNPDYPALQVMNTLLSGGFSSRLFQNIRTRKGLAYSVFGNYGCNAFYPGMFFVGAKTKSARTLEAVKAMKHELAVLQKEGVDQEELNQARDQILNSLVFRYDKPEEVLERRLHYEYRDMDPDSFEELVQGIREVTPADIQRVAQKYLDPDRLQVLLVGNRNELRSQLRTIGDLQEIDISLKPSPAE